MTDRVNSGPDRMSEACPSGNQQFAAPVWQNAFIEIDREIFPAVVLHLEKDSCQLPAKECELLRRSTPAQKKLDLVFRPPRIDNSHILWTLTNRNNNRNVRNFLNVHIIFKVCYFICFQFNQSGYLCFRSTMRHSFIPM